MEGSSHLSTVRERNGMSLQQAQEGVPAGSPAPTEGPLRPSPLLAWPGAVAGDPPDDAVPAHYGDPLREQRAWEDATGGFVDRSARDVLTVTGPDRLSWLHSLTSQHLSDLTPGGGAEALVLSPHGHVEHHLAVLDDGATAWIDVEAGTGAALLSFLEKMRFLLRVEPALVTDAYAVITLVGAATISDAVSPEVPRRAMPWGTDLIVARTELERIARELRDNGPAPVGLAAFEARRVEQRRPRLGFETDHRTIPNELPWLASAVHLNKGCYRGQETVARTHNLGRPPRRLVLLHLDAALPPAGSPVIWEGKQVGTIGTPAYHAELGPIALALIKRRVPDEAALRTGDEQEIAASIAID
jgi:folate-binding protein YgfZ